MAPLQHDSEILISPKRVQNNHSTYIDTFIFHNSLIVERD
jgi:hypothetical protein